MSKVLICKETEFPIIKYEIITQGICSYIVTIEKGDYTLNQIKEFFNTASKTEFFDILIKDEQKDDFYGFNSEHYKNLETTEEENGFKINFINQFIPTPDEIDIVNAKLEYLSIILDVDIDEI